MSDNTETDLGPCDRDGCDSDHFVSGWMLETGTHDAVFDRPVVKIFCSRGCADDYREHTA